MSPAIDPGALDPVPAWRRAVWAELSPGHRFLSKNVRGRYQTVWYTEDDKAASAWWRGIRRREGTLWRPWIWLGWYVKGNLRHIEVFTHTHTGEDRHMARKEKHEMARVAKHEIEDNEELPRAVEYQYDAQKMRIKVTVVEDAGALIYKDRAGAPMVAGLTEGSSNLATVTAEAIRAAAEPQE